MRPMWFFIFILGFSAACSKDKEPAAVESLDITANSVTQFEGDVDNYFRFKVALSRPSTETVRVNYSTSEVTASGNTDYLPSSGALEFAPGVTEAFVEVLVKGDTLKEGDETFQVEFSSTSQGQLTVNNVTGTIRNDDDYVPVSPDGYITPDFYTGYNLKWSDEFNGTQLNLAEWTPETGASGWGNNELQYYTGRAENVYLANGNLIIEAKKENYNGAPYTSARIITSNKKNFTFGRIDIRAKLPKGKGIWPALWMLGQNFASVGWPNCGEIDIMELIGSEPNKIYGSNHWGPQGATASIHTNNAFTLPAGQNFESKFHVFTLDWEFDKMRFMVDDQVFRTFTKNDVGSENYPFNAPFFFIFNIAVGGNWPGSPDATTVFPQQMIVDYVRVFQKN